MRYKEDANILEGLQDSISASSADYTDYDPIGLPDAKDIDNIKVIIRNHEKAHPGEIAGYVRHAREERQVEALTPGAKLNEKVASHRVMTLPGALMREVEEAYPLMFRNREHLRWFRKQFPMFNTTEMK